MLHRTAAEAHAFLDEHSFLWHQRFELADGVYAPGVNQIEWLLAQTPLPDSMAGMSVLDIGTTNGAMVFECERRGAERLVAVDILDDQYFGFAAIAEFLGSKAQFVQANVYEVADVLDETFDLVVFWGVLYHLRHPLLGLDSVRRVAKGRVLLETAVCDADRPDAGQFAQFHRTDELAGDGSNWWSPSIAVLRSWVGSAGFTVDRTIAIPPGHPAQRAMLDMRVTPGPPEYLIVSYERPLRLQPIERL